MSTINLFMLKFSYLNVILMIIETCQVSFRHAIDSPSLVKYNQLFYILFVGIKTTFDNRSKTSNSSSDLVRFA